MSRKLGVIMDPIATINPKKDSTLAILLAAKDKGWSIHYFEQPDLYKNNGKARGVGKQISVSNDLQCWYQEIAEIDVALGELDVIFMRKDPPFDAQFLYTTFLLDSAQADGALIVNNPQSLRDCNEKVFATEFNDLCPKGVISANSKILTDFYNEHQDIILKPLDGMGGASIFRVKQGDANLSVILETLTNHGQNSIMGQKYIPEIVDGDKRILLVNGKPAPFVLARIPARGETRGNLAAGGRGVAQPLSENDKKICDRVGPILAEKGLIFVGIDVIGDYLTEINVTSPTCIREIHDQEGHNIAEVLIEEVTSILSSRE